MKNKIIYAFLTAATIFFAIMYDGMFLPVLFIFEVLMFIVMFLLSFWMVRGISVKMEVKSPVATKGETVLIELCVKNKNWVPVNHLTINLLSSNGFTGITECETIKGAIQGSSEIRIACKLRSKYCGHIQVALGSIRIYDYMKVFSRIKKCQEKTNVNILPEIHHVETSITERTFRFTVEGEEYEQHRSGDDPSEIYQVREFRNGDTLQKVHWKLSAKTDELMTKEFSMPKGCKVLFLLDFFHENEKSGAGTLKRMDAFLETAVSLSFGMVREGCPHFVAWYDEKNGILNRKQVVEEEDFYEMMDELLHGRFYEQTYDLKAGYDANYPGRNLSTVLTLDEKLQLMCNGEWVMGFTKENLKAELEGYLLQV